MLQIEALCKTQNRLIERPSVGLEVFSGFDECSCIYVFSHSIYSIYFSYKSKKNWSGESSLMTQISPGEMGMKRFIIPIKSVSI